MERQYVHSINGEEVQEDDLNLIAEDGALADDRVLAELFRLKPFDSGSMSDVTKGILPYSGHEQGGTVIPNGATGSVRIYPFRALVASPLEASDDSKKNWRDIRSAIYIGDLTAAYDTQSFSNNASGDARWDLVYARVDVDQDEPGVTRYVKAAGPPITETPTTVSVVKATTVTIGVVTGTPDPLPEIPSLPSDGGGSYYIPIVAVAIADGFTSGTTIGRGDIYELMPVISLNRITGASTAGPSTSCNLNKDNFLPSFSSTVISDWANLAIPPRVYMPPSMVGEDVLYVALQVKGLSSTWSHTDGAIVDHRDWRRRVFTWQAFVLGGSSVDFAWKKSSTPNNNGVPQFDVGASNSSAANQAWGMGQSFFKNSTTGDLGSDLSVVCFLNNGNAGGTIGSGDLISLYVDLSTGQLKFTSGGTTPDCYAFIRISASAPYANSPFVNT